MTDYWFIFGAMTIDPNSENSILAAIAKANPRFTRVGVIIQEITNGAVPTWKFKPDGGYLDERATTDMRHHLRDWAAKHYPGTPPVISLYAAGKICQFFCTCQSGLRRALEQGGEVLQTAAQASAMDLHKPSAHFTTLLGATLIDSKLADALQTKEGISYAKEFGLDVGNGSTEWSTIQAFAAHPDLTKARAALFGIGQSWEPTCGQLLIFNDDFKRAAN